MTWRPRSPRTPPEAIAERTAKVIRLHHEGLTGAAIAERLGVAPTRVTDVLREAGLQRPRTRQERPSTRQVIASIRASQNKGPERANARSPNQQSGDKAVTETQVTTEQAPRKVSGGAR